MAAKHDRILSSVRTPITQGVPFLTILTPGTGWLDTHYSSQKYTLILLFPYIITISKIHQKRNVTVLTIGTLSKEDVDVPHVTYGNRTSRVSFDVLHQLKL